jgi:hypothetical protein
VNEFYKYDLLSNHWSEVKLLSPPPPRSFHTCNLVFDGAWKFFLFGGLCEDYTSKNLIDLFTTQEETYYNDLHVFELENVSMFKQLFWNWKQNLYCDVLIHLDS